MRNRINANFLPIQVVNMSRVKRIFHSFCTQPGYTLMRGGARFSMLRQLIANTKRTLDVKKKVEFIAECESRMDQTQFSGIDRKAFVKALRDDGAAFGLKLSSQTVSEIHPIPKKHPATRIEWSRMDLC